MFDYPILSLLIWAPIFVGILLIMMKSISDNLSQLITLLTTFLILIISIILTQAYDYTSSQLQFIERIEWISGLNICLLYTSPSPRDVEESRMPSSA